MFSDAVGLFSKNSLGFFSLVVSSTERFLKQSEKRPFFGVWQDKLLQFTCLSVSETKVVCQ